MSRPARGRGRGRATTPGADAAAIAARPLDGPLLCLDISSKAAGFAYFDPAGGPMTFGVLWPKGARDAVARIDAIVARVRALVEAGRPAAVLMEWSGGRTHGRIGKATGLSVLGAAQGAVRQALRDVGLPVATVTEAEWTRGVPKARRAATIALVVPEYADFRAAGMDPGLDCADGLGIGLWHFNKAREAELLARAERKDP